MPHCIIEHSADIDGRTLVPLVHAGALASGLFSADGSDIKVRSLAYDSYLTGGKHAGFVHVQVRLLSGRTEAQKKTVTAAVLERLAAQGLPGVSITVEAADMDRPSYAKRAG